MEREGEASEGGNPLPNNSAVDCRKTSNQGDYPIAYKLSASTGTPRRRLY